jgi:hypothetical protein
MFVSGKNTFQLMDSGSGEASGIGVFHMRLEFRAEEGGFEDVGSEAHCLICGFYGHDSDGAEHYMHLTRGFEGEDPSEDWGVHCEFDGQHNGDYNCIRRCQLTRTTLAVDLSQQIDWQKKYTGICVDISGLDEEPFAAILAGLPRIFHGTKGILRLP